MNAQQIITNAQSVRQRLMNPPNAIGRQPSAIGTLKIENMRLARQVEEMAEEIAKLREDKASLEQEGQKANLQAGEYYRAIIHYIKKLDEVSGVEAAEFADFPDKKRQSAKSIICEVLRDFPGITIDDILGPKRTHPIIEARFRAIYEIHTRRPDMSYPVIGRIFNRDHTTILHAVRKMKKEEAA